MLTRLIGGIGKAVRAVVAGDDRILATAAYVHHLTFGAGLSQSPVRSWASETRTQLAQSTMNQCRQMLVQPDLLIESRRWPLKVAHLFAQMAVLLYTEDDAKKLRDQGCAGVTGLLGSYTVTAVREAFPERSAALSDEEVVGLARVTCNRWEFDLSVSRFFHDQVAPPTHERCSAWLDDAVRYSLAFSERGYREKFGLGPAIDPTELMVRGLPYFIAWSGAEHPGEDASQLKGAPCPEILASRLMDAMTQSFQND